MSEIIGNFPNVSILLAASETTVLCSGLNQHGSLSRISVIYNAKSVLPVFHLPPIRTRLGLSNSLCRT